MAGEGVVSDIVTKFFLNTCRLRPQISRPVVQAARCCAEMVTLHPDDEAEADAIPLTTGSVAEFYIEPMLPHVGDVDVMHHWSTVLAIPRGHPPPTQLPAEFSNYVQVFEIVDSHLPGYVYLELRYTMMKGTEDGNYSYSQVENGIVKLLGYRPYHVGEVHGPAMCHRHNALPYDVVLCVRCLSWPSQAADWPTRHRNYDWPDSATVDHVVNNGCDVDCGWCGTSSV